MTFQLIDQERAHHAVSRLCSVLNVTRQGYWAWKQRPASRRRLEDERLKRRILAAWTKSDRTYGAPRLHAELRLAGGVKVGKKRVARLMRELEIEGVSRRRGRVRTTIPDKWAAPAPDLVNRNFTAAGPDETWVADITYVPTHEGWLFLAAVMDLYSRKIVGWSMRDDLEAPLVVDAISMAITRRKPKPGLVHHSDRGSQYASIAMGRTLRDSKIMASMGSKGDPGTTPARRAASRRSRTSSSSGAPSRLATRRGSRSSATSRASTTRSAATRAWRCAAPTNTNTDTGRTTPRQPPRKTVSTETGQPHGTDPKIQASSPTRPDLNAPLS
jgi:putative transposase